MTDVSLKVPPLSLVPHEFLVLWQSPDSPGYRCVGTLTRERDAYRFEYSDQARSDESFTGFASFPHLDEVYRSGELFPFFANRVMTPRRDDYQEYLQSIGLHDMTPDPFVILARTLGRRVTDQIQVLPVPEIGDEGRLSFRFLVNGARHVDPKGQRLRDVARGSDLHLAFDPANEASPYAVLVGSRPHVIRDEALGYVPEVLAGLVGSLLDADAVVRVQAEVVNHVGEADVPAQLRLLARLDAVVPSDFDVRRALNVPGAAYTG